MHVKFTAISYITLSSSVEMLSKIPRPKQSTIKCHRIQKKTHLHVKNFHRDRNNEECVKISEERTQMNHTAWY